MQSDQQIRAFICIELPQELKVLIKKFQAGLRLPKHDFIKWVNPESIHFTLKFMGNTSISKLEAINSELDKLVKKRPSFNLLTAEVGCFPNLKKIRVFWLGLAGDIDKAVDLQAAIDDSLFKLGFPKEERPFEPHLTLARVKDGCSFNDRWEFSELIKYARFEPQYSFKINSIILMRSQLNPGGPVYTKISEYLLSL